MKPVFRPLHALFAAEVTAIDLMQLYDPDTLANRLWTWCIFPAGVRRPRPAL